MTIDTITQEEVDVKEIITEKEAEVNNINSILKSKKITWLLCGLATLTCSSIAYMAGLAYDRTEIEGLVYGLVAVALTGATMWRFDYNSSIIRDGMNEVENLETEIESLREDLREEEYFTNDLGYRRLEGA